MPLQTPCSLTVIVLSINTAMLEAGYVVYNNYFIMTTLAGTVQSVELVVDGGMIEESRFDSCQE
jgi:hypothetical protein